MCFSHNTFVVSPANRAIKFIQKYCLSIPKIIFIILISFCSNNRWLEERMGIQRASRQRVRPIRTNCWQVLQRWRSWQRYVWNRSLIEICEFVVVAINGFVSLSCDFYRVRKVSNRIRVTSYSHYGSTRSHVKSSLRSFNTWISQSVHFCFWFDLIFSVSEFEKSENQFLPSIEKVLPTNNRYFHLIIMFVVVK